MGYKEYFRNEIPTEKNTPGVNIMSMAKSTLLITILFFITRAKIKSRIER